MGFFSWKTADTQETIVHEATGVQMRPVYLLQPNGKEPICEESYGGYGVFGEISANTWLAENNLSKQTIANLKGRGLSLEEMGILISNSSKYYVDTRDDCCYIYGYTKGILEPSGLLSFVDDNGDPANYGSIYTGVVINDLIKKGIWKERSCSKLFCIGGKIAYPLKFSYDKNAVYEDLLGSRDCENQGYIDED